jgi:tetratricopeptide (TPR) repeat protein
MMKNQTNAAPQGHAVTLPAAEKLTIEQALQRAMKHQAEGKLKQAEGLLRQVLQAQPKNPVALHLLGIVAHQAGKTDQGIQLIRQAIEISPRTGQFHSNLGEMLRLTGRLDEAIRHGEQAVALDPASATSHSNLGIAWYDKGELEKAEACQQRALALNPRLAPALNNLGSICRDRRDKEQAVSYYRRALEAMPHHLESMNNLGAVLNETDRPEESAKVLLQAVRLNPKYAEAHCNIGNTFLLLEQFDKANAAFNRALSLKPDYPEACQGLARLHQEQNRIAEAEVMASKALALAPLKAEVHSLLGGIYSESGFPEKAEQCYARALELDPDLQGAHLGRGHLRMEQGRMEEAEADFAHALQQDPNSLGARLSLTQIRKTVAGDDNMEALVREAEKLDTMPETKAMPLHFALGKCYDDTKQYDLAFQHYLEGCRLKRKRIQYNADDNDLLLQNIRNIFSREMIQRLGGNGCTSDLPIFVLGMPRSGTTLTEQIIASHPLVHGAGELPDLLQLANRPHGAQREGYPFSIQGLTQAELRMLGEQYVTGLRARNAEAHHITDKMPANFNYIGLIHLMLPNAKIVHVKRDPVDTCVSAFSRLFNRSQHQSYDLAELGRYYRNYGLLMNHWRSVLPAGAFHEVQYEELVADTEGQARALIAYCGLEWDQACLDFHKTERNIRTASVTQVRQPIYKTSVEKWRHYEKHLGPLLDALGDLVPARQ